MRCDTVTGHTKSSLSEYDVGCCCAFWPPQHVTSSISFKNDVTSDSFPESSQELSLKRNSITSFSLLSKAELSDSDGAGKSEKLEEEVAKGDGADEHEDSGDDEEKSGSGRPYGDDVDDDDVIGDVMSDDVDTVVSLTRSPTTLVLSMVSVEPAEVKRQGEEGGPARDRLADRVGTRQHESSRSKKKGLSVAGTSMLSRTSSRNCLKAGLASARNSRSISHVSANTEQGKSW